MSENKYKVVNGTSYHIETKDKIISILENARQTNQRIRIFYGDIETGIDWNDGHDTIGTIGRSNCFKCKGELNKIPLLIKNRNSCGGGGILDRCIIKITIDKNIVYQHDNYDCGTFTYGKTENKELINDGYLFKVLRNGNINANFKSEIKAIKYIDFMKGIRNKI